jgi:hypothetical protein
VPACFGCEFAVGIGDFGDIGGEEHSVIRPFGREVHEENEDISERGGFFVFLLLCEEQISETDRTWWAGGSTSQTRPSACSLCFWAAHSTG